MDIAVANVYTCDEMDQFDYFKSVGFDAVDMTLNPYFNRGGKFEYNIDYVTEDEVKEHFTALRKRAEQAGVYVCQTHGTFGGHPGNYNFDYDEIYKRLCWSIKATHYLGCKQIVIHPIILPGRRHDLLKDYNFNRAVEFYRMLEPTLEKYDVICCLENMFVSDKTYKHICSTVLSRAEEMVEMCNVLGDRYKICYDVGHALVTQDDPIKYVYTCGDKLIGLHAHGNDGYNDLHDLPFMRYHKIPGTEPTTIDWHEFMRALKDIGYKGTLDFEIGPCGPDEVKPASHRYLAKIGRYLADVFENHEPRK